MKRFCWMLGILAVLVASAPMTADAIRPPRQVAPIAPPGEIGDDDQPGKDIEGEQPSQKVTNPDQKVEPDRVFEPSVARSRAASRAWVWLQSLFMPSRSVRHP